MKFKKIVATCLTLSSLALPVCVSANAWSWPWSKTETPEIPESFCTKSFPGFTVSRFDILDLWKIKIYLSKCHDETDNEVEEVIDKLIGFNKDFLNLERNYKEEIEAANNDEDSCKEIYSKYDDAFQKLDTERDSYFKNVSDDVMSQANDIGNKFEELPAWELADILGL